MMTGIAVPDEDNKRVSEDEQREVNPDWTDRFHSAICRCKCGGTFNSRYQLVGPDLKVWTEHPCPTCSRHDYLWAAQTVEPEFEDHHTLVRVPIDPNMVPPRPR